MRPTVEDLAFENKTGLAVGHWGKREGEARFKGIVNGWRPHHEEFYPFYYDLDQLYDLQKDPQEKVNLAGSPDYADQLIRMKSLLADQIRTMERPFGEFN